MFFYSRHKKNSKQKTHIKENISGPDSEKFTKKKMSVFSAQGGEYPTQADVNAVTSVVSDIVQEGLTAHRNLLDVSKDILAYVDQYLVQGGYAAGSETVLYNAANQVLIQAVNQTIISSQGVNSSPRTVFPAFSPGYSPQGSTVLPSGNIFVPGSAGGYFSPSGNKIEGDTYSGFVNSPTTSPFAPAPATIRGSVSPFTAPAATARTSVFSSQPVQGSVFGTTQPMTTFGPAFSPLSSPRYSPIPITQQGSPFGFAGSSSSSAANSPFASPRGSAVPFAGSSNSALFTSGAPAATFASSPYASVQGTMPSGAVFASSPYATLSSSAESSPFASPSSPVFASSPHASPRGSANTGDFM